MPLQVRRGTEAERLAMTQKLADGELLWITDDKKLYVGDGVTSTPTLAPVTGFNTENAQDAAASLFTTATHNGIAFSYDDLAGTLTANVTLTNYQGVIEADGFVGSVFADNSTMLIDGMLGRIVGPVYSDVTGNVTGNLTGNVSGDVNGVVTGTAGSSITGTLNGSVTGSLTGNVTGNVTGDLKGSVFGDDSTMLVDGTNSLLRAGNLTIGNSQIQGGDYAVTITSNVVEPLEIKSLTTGTSGGIPIVNIKSSKGTIDAPTTTAASDVLGGLTFAGYANGDYQSAVTLLTSWDSTATLTDSNPASILTVYTGDNNSGVNQFLFDHNGMFSSGTVRVASTFTTAPDTRPTGAARVVGMIIFETTTNTFQGWNGSTWTTLG